MYKNILLPLDGSKLAKEIVSDAIEFAKICGAKVTLLQVLDVTPAFKHDRATEITVLSKRAERSLIAIKEMIEDEGVSAELVIEDGKSYEKILEYAEQKDIDLIIMKTHGMGGFGRWALGSVSDKVMRHSTIPVLLLRSRTNDLLRGKTVLAVDDEQDVLDTLEEQLDVCEVHKATSRETALEHLNLHEYDAAILDIMGVDGFDLLEKTVAMGIPTVMLTAHAITADSLEKSLKHGAFFFLPKEKLMDINEILAEIMNSGGKPIWAKVFGRFSPYFSKRFRWTEKDADGFIKGLNKVLNATGKDE